MLMIVCFIISHDAFQCEAAKDKNDVTYDIPTKSGDKKGWSFSESCLHY